MSDFDHHDKDIGREEERPAASPGTSVEKADCGADQNVGDDTDGSPRFCRKCGASMDGSDTCPACGAKRGKSSQAKASGSMELEAKPEPTEPEEDSKAHHKRVIKINIAVAIALGVCIFNIVSYGVKTAYRWEVVDNPGHYEEYETGKYIVTMDDVNPCYVGQDWTDCIAAYQAEYNRECTKPLAGSSSKGIGRSSYQQAAYGTHYMAALRYHPANQALCNRYGEMISDMQSKDGPGYYVSSLGSWGHLHSKPETERRLVGRKTHEAVCYFGFIGECPDED